VNESGRGDQVLQFKVEIPKKLDAKQEALLRELARELGEDVSSKRGFMGLGGRNKK
jgi:DnaJ-class molecular chaperone